MVDTKALYQADTLEEGLAVLLKPMPHWVPLTTLITAGTLYYGSYRFRLLLSKVRHLQRVRIARRDAEERARQALIQEEADATAAAAEEDALAHTARDTNGDPTEVSDADVHEFCMSLGILLPRDEDLKLRVEQMIHDSPVPQGFVLVRSSAGYVRFQNQQTEELTFFYSATLRDDICGIVKARNEEQYKRFFGSEFVAGATRANTIEETTGAAAAASGAADGSGEAGLIGPSLRRINWNEVDDDGTDPNKDQSGWAAFHDVLNWFVAREKAKIETEMAAQKAEYCREQSLQKKESSMIYMSREGSEEKKSRVRARVTFSLSASTAEKLKQQQQQQSRSNSISLAATPPLPPPAPKAVEVYQAQLPATSNAKTAASPDPDDSRILNKPHPPADNNNDAHFNPPGLPPVPKRIPTPRSRQNSPAAASGVLERSASNMSNSGGSLPRTPSWRAKSPTLPPPQVPL